MLQESPEREPSSTITDCPTRSDRPIINCHTHIFTGANVPPFIGKTYLFAPLYRLASVPVLLWICNKYYKSEFSPYNWRHKTWSKIATGYVYQFKMFFRRPELLRFLTPPVNLFISLHGIIYLLQWIVNKAPGADEGFIRTGKSVVTFFERQQWFINPGSAALKTFVVFFMLLFIKYGRTLVFFVLKKTWSLLAMLPDKKTIAFIGRYVNIGRFAYFKTSSQIFQKMRDQYPPGTGFVILPMDMEYMDAGAVKKEGQYRQQMSALARLKEENEYTVFPFVFIDPRRIVEEGEQFLSWTHDGSGQVLLDNCFVRDYVETKKFSGFKIYPALGYYPFDEHLLALWKYAADNALPITTHCIKGTIFYRG